MALCLLAVVSILQCVQSAHKGKKNYENKDHQHNIFCASIEHKEENRPGHKVEDNRGLVGDKIYEHGVRDFSGFDNHKDIVLEKFRWGVHSRHRQ